MPRYWRRRREGEPTPRIAAIDDAAESGVATGPSVPVRGRRRAQHFGAHYLAACEAIGLTADDQARIVATRQFIVPYIAELAEQVQRVFALRTPASIADATKEEPEQPGIEATTNLVECIVRGELNAETGEYLASLAHDQVRPRNGNDVRIRGTSLVMAMSIMQSATIRILSDSLSDRSELSSAAIAWSKVMMIDLDLLLTVHGSIEATPRWY